MRLEIIDHSEEWDHFVMGHPDASFGHLFGWQKIIARVYGHRPIYLAARDASPASCKIRALLPLFRFRRPFCSVQWVSVPFLDHAGVLADDRESGSFLLEKSWDKLTGNKKPMSLCLRQDNAFDAAELLPAASPPAIFSQKIQLALPLVQDSAKMLAAFPSKLRSQIKKGIKNGLQWKIGGQELLSDFYRVFSRNMRDLGSPVHSRSFFKAIFETFGENAAICIIYHEDIAAAGGFVLRFKNRLVNPWASSLREYRHLNTNMLLYWQMISYACETGLEIFDMGRSSRGASTYRFKKQWGPVETQLSWYTWKTGSPSLPHETLQINSWRRLPLWSANLAGPLIRKYISL